LENDMKKLLIAALASGAVISAALPAAAQVGDARMVQTVDGPVLSFSVSEAVLSKPDVVFVRVGVQVTAATAVEAMRQNAVAMDKLIKAVKARGVKDEQIQTTGISLSPQYDYSNRVDGQPPRFVGYQVSNNVRVESSKVDDIGPMLDALVAAGGNNIDGPNFSVKDSEAKLASVRGKAMQKAQAKAQDYARLAGYRSVELISISEGGFSGPQPVMLERAMAADSAAKATPIEPGRVSNVLNLSVSYRLIR
jgi:hypothetical protein